MPLRSDPTVWFNAPGVVVAYQPVGALDALLARQNVGNDLRMAGRHTAQPGVLPKHDPKTGWAFNGSTQWLNTGVVPTLNGSWTMLIRYVYSSGGNYPTVAGQRENVSTFPDLAICVDTGATGTSNQTVFRNSHVTGFSTTPRLGSGVACIAGNKAYWNGENIGTLTVGSATGTRTIYIGAQNEVGTASYKFPGTVQAVVISSITLAPAHVARYSRQMAYCDANPDWSVWSRRHRYYYAPAVALAAMRRRQADAVRVGSRGVVE